MTNQIRRATSLEDHQSCALLFLESRRHGFHWLPPERFRLEDYGDAVLDEEVWMALDGAELVGFASIYLPCDFLHNLFIAPSRQRQGIGALLLETFLSRVKRPAMLKCLQANHRALSFYKKHGWRILEAEDGEPGPCWIMLKD